AEHGGRPGAEHGGRPGAEDCNQPVAGRARGLRPRAPAGGDAHDGRAVPRASGPDPRPDDGSGRRPVGRTAGRAVPGAGRAPATLAPAGRHRWRPPARRGPPGRRAVGGRRPAGPGVGPAVLGDRGATGGRGVTALVRYLLADLARSQRWVAPMAVYLAVVGI